jgi:hypothetical protein
MKKLQRELEMMRPRVQGAQEVRKKVKMKKLNRDNPGTEV